MIIENSGKYMDTLSIKAYHRVRVLVTYDLNELHKPINGLCEPGLQVIWPRKDSQLLDDTLVANYFPFDVTEFTTRGRVYEEGGWAVSEPFNGRPQHRMAEYMYLIIEHGIMN